MKRPDQGLYLAYILLALTDILLLNVAPEFRFFSKPWLMPVLLLAYRREVAVHDLFSRKIMFALFLSWLGDLALMFGGGIMFIAGLSFFLAAHIAYIAYFRSIKSNKTSFLKRRPVMLLAVFVFVFELLYVLWPGLGSMAGPVSVYAIVIGTMLAFAGWQYGKLSDGTARLFMVGALCFVVSDSLLAVARFRFPFSHSGTWVMLTYCLAQLLIIKGSVAHLRERSMPGLSTEHT
jgi:uncharacterized membrane protein YhhN